MSNQFLQNEVKVNNQGFDERIKMLEAKILKSDYQDNDPHRLVSLYPGSNILVLL